MNVLLTSVGRRSYLVKYFQSALEGKGKVFGVNSEAMSSGMYACDESFVVPLVDDVNYIPTLLKIAIDNDIKIIIPLFDIDLPYLAEKKELFIKNDITIIVSDVDTIEVANDKWKTFLFLKENNFSTPLTYISLDNIVKDIKNKIISYPLIIKPRWGMGSIGVYKADNYNELVFFYNYVRKSIKQTYITKMNINPLNDAVLIQEWIDGIEYGIDVFNNLESSYLMSIAKEKIAMRAGETDVSLTVIDDKLEELSQSLSQKLKHIGNLDVDVLFDGTTYYIVEFNARFGGGFPFSYLSGANFIQLLIQLLNKEMLSLPKIEAGTLCLKDIVPVKVESNK